MKRFEEFTKEDLWALRKEIVVNSIHFDDYRNSFGIDKYSVSNFFDSYLDYLEELMLFDGKEDANDKFFDYLDEYDNSDNLLEFYNTYETFDWVEYEEDDESPEQYTNVWFANALMEKYSKVQEMTQLDKFNLVTDFTWLMESGEVNAKFGCYAESIFEMNSTAQELVRHDERLRPFILACAKVGYFRCAEDDDCVRETMEKALLND